MNFYIEMESTARELPYKIYLANFLASRGHSVLLAQSDFLRGVMWASFGGVYVGKNVFTRPVHVQSPEWINKLHQNSFVVVYNHEEGGVFEGSSFDDVIRESLNRYPKSFFRPSDSVIYWGEIFEQAEVAEISCDSFVSGSPTFELFRPKYDPIFSEFDNPTIDIVINGNHPSINGLGGLLRPEVLEYLDKNSVEFGLEWITGETLSFARALKTILLAESDQRLESIGYRPHPSESREFIDLIAGKSTKLKTLGADPLEVEIRCANVIAHEGCTTGLQAYVAEKCVVSMSPDGPARAKLPALASRQILSNEDMFQTLVDVKENRNRNFGNELAGKKLFDREPTDYVKNLHQGEANYLEKFCEFIETKANDVSVKKSRRFSIRRLEIVDDKESALKFLKSKTFYKIRPDRKHRAAYMDSRWQFSDDIFFKILRGVERYQGHSNFCTFKGSLFACFNW